MLLLHFRSSGPTWGNKMTFILDGKGKGFQAQVTANNRLGVDAVTLSSEEAAIREGEGWQITSGLLTLTGSGESAILFIKNTSELDLILDRVVLVLGSSTDGDGDWEFKTLRNPTAGSIITNELQAGISNSNHGSGKLPSTEAFRGVENDTLTDGTGVALPVQQTENRSTLPLGRRLTTNSSIGFVLTAPPGNTSAKAVVVTHLYYDTSRI